MLLFVPVTFFWATYEQQGNTIALWADDYTDRTINLSFWRGEIPPTWFQAFNPFMIFAFTPLVVALWARQAQRGGEPSTVAKMALGCLGVALANLIMVARRDCMPAAARASWLWLIGYFVVDHHRRTLSLADRPFAGDEGRAGPRRVDDDGVLAGDELPRQFHRRLARQLLVEHEPSPPSF